MRSFSLYSDCRWNGFSKTEELATVVFHIMHIHSIFHMRNFMRAKPLILEKKKEELRAKLRKKSGMLNLRAKYLG